MSFVDVVLLYRARLRARAVLVQESLAILGIAVGVALLFATQVAGTSLTRSVQQLTHEVVGRAQLQLDARGPEGFDERVLGSVRSLRGVKLALPVLEQQATVIGPKGQRAVDLIGTEPQFAKLTGSLLRRFSAEQLAAQRAIALPAPLAGAIGAGSLETIKLQIGAQDITTLLATTLHESEIGGLVDSPIALAPVRYAQRVAGLQGRITRIFVQAQPGQERAVRGELAPLAASASANVESADFDSVLFATAVAPQSQSETLFSAISALVGFMFALNAMLITVPSRRKLIEQIRPQGATSLMLVQILLFDAAVIGVLACGLGLALGDLLSIVAFHTTPGYLSFAFPVSDDRIITWQCFALAIGVGLLAALAGVFWPALSVLKRPRQQTHKRAAHRRAGTRILAGAACLLVTTLTLLVDARATVLGNVTLVIALVCLLPSVFDGAVSGLARAQRSFHSAAVRLTVTQLRAPGTRVRSLAITATVAVAVFGIVEFQGTQANLKAGLDASARGIDSSAAVWITPAGASNAFATTPFHSVARGALTRVRGVGTVGVYRGSFLDWGKRRLWTLAPPTSAAAESILSGQLATGDASVAASRVSEGGWAVISQALASEEDLHVGQAFTLPSPQPTRMRIAALSSNLGWPPGAVIISASTYERAWQSSNPSALQIQTAPGASPGMVGRLVRQKLGANTGLIVETAQEREHRHYALANQGLSRLTQIRMLVLIAAVLAVSTALAAMMWQRRELIAFIKCAGYPRRVLLQWLLCESAVMLVVGCSAGAVLGLYAQLLGSHFLAAVTGFPIVFNIEGLAAATSFVLIAAVVGAIVALPGYLVVRVPARTASPAY